MDKDAQIVYKNVDDLVPYKNNPRNNADAVEYVANSIKEFGFKVPIVIAANNEVICGHTRLKAAKQLNLKRVPCIIADDLNDEQIKAFRLADNKVAEMATWDFDLLDNELFDIEGIDMTEFAFELPDTTSSGDDDDIDVPENERMRTNNAYNMELFNPDDTDGFYQMPVIHKCNVIPDDVIGYNYMASTDKYNCGVHFFIDDYQFERLWNNPQAYVERMQQFKCFFTPDFSLYMDMAMSVKVWNVYRSRLLGAYWQRIGLNVIPTISWAEPDTFQFCFDGIEKGCVVAVSSIGVKRDADAMKIWRDGMDAMIEKIQPEMILLYGGYIEDYDYKGIKVKCYENAVTERMKNSKQEV